MKLLDHNISFYSQERIICCLLAFRLQQKTLKLRFFLLSALEVTLSSLQHLFSLSYCKNFLLVIVDKLFFFFFFLRTGVWLTLQLLGGIQFIFISRHWENHHFQLSWNWARQYYIGLVERTVLCQFRMRTFNFFSFWHFLLLERHLLIWTGHQTEAAWNSEAVSKDNALKVHQGHSAYWREAKICPAKPLKGRGCLWLQHKWADPDRQNIALFSLIMFGIQEALLISILHFPSLQQNFLLHFQSSSG